MSLLNQLSIKDIKPQYELAEKDVKVIMRKTLKAGSYKTWRKRIKNSCSRREYPK